MLKFGDVGQNFITLAVLFGFFYLIYAGLKNDKMKEKIGNIFKGGLK